MGAVCPPGLIVKIGERGKDLMIEDNKLEQFIKYSLLVHVIAGCVSLLAGLGAIIFRNKIKQHRPFGSVYFWSMTVVFVTSLYFKRRARNWRARRLRVNALAPRPGRSRFAACVRRFAARGCVRGGLARWASAVAWPSAWPTVAEVSPGCLSGHRETFPRSGVSGERSRCVYVSRVTTADSGGS